MRTLTLILICTIALFSYKKSNRRATVDLCLSVSKTTVAINESISVSSCGDTPPSDYVDADIDWGDGTITSGISGAHSFSEVGEYTIRLLLNGDPADEVTDTSSDKVRFYVTVEE